MKKLILNHKILLFSILFFIFLILFGNNNVFASVDYTYNDTTVTLPDLPFSINEHPSYVLIYNDGEKTYQVGYPQSDYDKFFIVRQYGICIQYYIKNTTTKGQWVYYQYNITTNTWGKSKVTSANSLQHVNPVVVSTFDIYDSPTSDTLFFQVAPPEEEIPVTPEEITQATTLPEIMEQLEKVEVLKEIVALLPVILSVLVSLIALRKALQMLLNFLRVS